MNAIQSDTLASSIVEQVPEQALIWTVQPNLYALSIILPTRNESDNIAALLRRIEAGLQGIAAEVIFIDDSDDDTPRVIQQMSERTQLPIRLITRSPEQRKGGLGGAVTEGFRAARGRWMCVMDADLQHPPELIPKLLSHAQTTTSDLVIGSRFADGASTPGMEQWRTAISHTFILSARLLFINRLRRVTDPLTGFFVVRRDMVDLNQLRPNGFKILLEILIQFPKLQVSELGFTMEARQAGTSKASMNEVMRYYCKLIELRFTRGNPRFMRFAVVGLSGLLLNNLALVLFNDFFHLYYLFAVVLATQASTLWNFLLTEYWVFGDRKNVRPMWVKLVGFYTINNAMLLVRGPMISGMVEWLGFGLVLANLLSILAATLLRYFVADKFLWSPKNAVPLPTEAPRG